MTPTTQRISTRACLLALVVFGSSSAVGCSRSATNDLAKDPAISAFPPDEVKKVIGFNSDVPKSERRDAVLAMLQFRSDCRVVEKALAQMTATGSRDQLSVDKLSSRAMKEVYDAVLKKAFSEGDAVAIRSNVSTNCAD